MRPLGIDIRAGLHTGEVELRGDDIGGIAVQVAARVMGEARPGEILGPGTVTDLLAGSGIEFIDRSEHELRGMGGRRLFPHQSWLSSSSCAMPLVQRPTSPMQGEVLVARATQPINEAHNDCGCRIPP